MGARPAGSRMYGRMLQGCVAPACEALGSVSASSVRSTLSTAAVMPYAHA